MCYRHLTIRTTNLNNKYNNRSSCSNDRCLFITNMDTMPNVDNIRFSSITSSNFTEYDTLYNATNPVIPSQTSFLRHSYHKAVDQNTETCWKSIECKHNIS